MENWMVLTSCMAGVKISNIPQLRVLLSGLYFPHLAQDWSLMSSLLGEISEKLGPFDSSIGCLWSGCVPMFFKSEKWIPDSLSRYWEWSVLKSKNARVQGQKNSTTAWIFYVIVGYLLLDLHRTGQQRLWRTWDHFSYSSQEMNYVLLPQRYFYASFYEDWRLKVRSVVFLESYSLWFWKLLPCLRYVQLHFRLPRDQKQASEAGAKWTLDCRLGLSSSYEVWELSLSFYFIFWVPESKSRPHTCQEGAVPLN